MGSFLKFLGPSVPSTGNDGNGYDGDGDDDMIVIFFFFNKNFLE